MMKNLLYIFVALTVCMPAFAVTNATQSRRSVSAKMVGSSRMTSSVNQLNPLQTSSVRVYPDDYDEEEAAAAAEREKARAACEANNIGVGNAFVWASRNSNTSNYAMMVEDVKNPENNVCFALVSVTSNDPKIDLSGIPSKYFEMGRSVVCGEWADSEVIEKRILAAKKTTRALATTGAVVGGIGLGVGVMEAFGNKLIGNKVEGQAALSGAALLRSQLLTMKEKGMMDEYNSIKAKIKEIEDACKDDIWKTNEMPEDIKEICEGDERLNFDVLNNEDTTKPEKVKKEKKSKQATAD